MKRRDFLTRSAQAAVTLAAAPLLAALPAGQPLAPIVMTDAALGISMRFIQQFEPISARLVNRLDLLWAMPELIESCQVVSG